MLPITSCDSNPGAGDRETNSAPACHTHGSSIVSDTTAHSVSEQIGDQPYYRLYILNPQGRIATPAQDISAEDDEKAVEQAKALIDDQDIELWRNNKCIFKGRRAAVREPKQRPRAWLRY
jgi:hypothetical protein